MNPRALHVVPDHATDHHGPLAVEVTRDGATVHLAPETAFVLAQRIVKAATPEQMARVTAAACATGIPGGTGVTLLAALLLEHVRLDLDGRDLDALVDQLDDAGSPVPAPAADPVETAAADAADTHLDLLRGK